MDFINLLKRKQKPALGCTEPGAIALAASKAAEYLKSPVITIELYLSRNIMKNAMNVGIAGTTEKGSAMAAALGAIAGNSSFGLECLKGITQQDVCKARKMVEDGAVRIMLKDTEEKIYIRACCIAGEEKAEVTIRQEHDHITGIVVNGEIKLDLAVETENEEEQEENFAFSDILDFVENVPAADIEFLLEGINLNSKLVEEGLNNDYGLCVGRKLFNRLQQMSGHKADKQGTDEQAAAYASDEYAVSCTAAAVDARMAGCRLPVMSLDGSGNQGITAMIPIAVLGKYKGLNEEQMLRTLALSELVTLYIKKHIGKLSAICACAVASSVGVSCGIVYMCGGSVHQMISAIKNMIADISGLICDGAKDTCALKIATGVSSALQCAHLALVDDRNISGREGIIDEELDQTIKNLGRIATEGMTPTDRVILDIMTCK